MTLYKLTIIITHDDVPASILQDSYPVSPFQIIQYLHRVDPARVPDFRQTNDILSQKAQRP